MKIIKKSKDGRYRVGRFVVVERDMIFAKVCMYKTSGMMVVTNKTN